MHPTNVWRKTKPSDWAIGNGWPGKAFTAKHYMFTNMVYAPDHWSSFIYAGVASRAALALKMLGKCEQAKGRRLNAECTPVAIKWPSAASYFDVYRWAGMAL